jgi:hypothetical protein
MATVSPMKTVERAGEAQGKHAPGGGKGPRRLSEELQRLIETFAERPVRLREVVAAVRHRSYTMLLILLTFPFCTPVPLPGVSLPFGLAVAFIGLRLALGQKPWLPARLLDAELPPRFFQKLLSAARRLVAWLEHFLKPRWSWFFELPLAQHGLGAVICCCGLLMMLPFPIPFSNGLPALTVLLLAAAMLEEDGAFALAGGVMFALTLGYFAVVFWGGTEAVSLLKETFGNFLAADDPSPAADTPAP